MQSMLAFRWAWNYGNSLSFNLKDRLSGFWAEGLDEAAPFGCCVALAGDAHPENNFFLHFLVYY
jgi:hypothetical protein